MKRSQEKIEIVVIWKRKDMDGDAAWHIRQFRTHSAGSNFAKTQRERADVEHVRTVDIT